MRLKVTLDTQKQWLPFTYHRYLQGMIYHALPKDLGDFFHDEGFGQFKLFTFSELIGKYEVKDRGLVFTSPIEFYMTSISSDFLNQLYLFFLQNKNVTIGQVSCQVLKVEAVDDLYYRDNHIYEIKTLSPITCYKTDENHFTTYFHPKSKDFEKSIQDNLKKKYIELYKGIGKEFFDIVEIKRFKELKVKYKNSVVIAYQCTLNVHVSDKYLSLMMHTGLGSKNSAGFGMIELLRND